MKATLILVAVYLAVALATSETEYRSAFTNWQQKYGKSYISTEFQARYNIFKVNYDFVNAWDSEAKGFEVELNHFADLTLEEFSSIYLGLKYDAAAQKNKRLLHNPHIVASEAIPTSVDWRTQGYVTGVKDQGQCGSCWSFSTTGSTEGAHFKATKNLVSLSEQQLVDCSASFGNQGCNGGLMDDAFKYIEKNGIVAESAYPYTAAVGTCNLSGKKSVATLASSKDIPQGSETALTAALSTVGPVSVAIDASHTSFQLYKSGVYSEPACSATALDHGVLAVGYGADSNGKAYYIVKNSWGTVWGQAGYIWMTRNNNNQCGIATMASYPIA